MIFFPPPRREKLTGIHIFLLKYQSSKTNSNLIIGLISFKISDLALEKKESVATVENCQHISIPSVRSP